MHCLQNGEYGLTSHCMLNFPNNEGDNTKIGLSEPVGRNRTPHKSSCQLQNELNPLTPLLSSLFSASYSMF